LVRTSTRPVEAPTDLRPAVSGASRSSRPGHRGCHFIEARRPEVDVRGTQARVVPRHTQQTSRPTRRDELGIELLEDPVELRISPVYVLLHVPVDVKA